MITQGMRVALVDGTHGTVALCDGNNALMVTDTPVSGYSTVNYYPEEFPIERQFWVLERALRPLDEPRRYLTGMRVRLCHTRYDEPFGLDIGAVGTVLWSQGVNGQVAVWWDGLQHGHGFFGEAPAWVSIPHGDAGWYMRANCLEINDDAPALVDDDEELNEYCEDCGEDVERLCQCNDCGDYMCRGCLGNHDCMSEERDGVVYGYNYCPPPIFHGTGPRYYGVELEVDGGEDGAEPVHDLDPDESLFYLKEDGSLDCGFEVVTHPCSLAFHMKKYPWKEVTETARGSGYKSHDTNTCGLHVHVSRAALGKTVTQQDMTLSKLVILMSRFWPQVVKFSRRTPDQLHWCQLNLPTDAHINNRALTRAKFAIDKYAAINTSHPATLEFRVFRGTLKVQSILAAIQLVDVMVETAMTHGIGWCITQATWEEMTTGKYSELTAYIAEREQRDVSHRSEDATE